LVYGTTPLGQVPVSPANKENLALAGAISHAARAYPAGAVLTRRAGYFNWRIAGLSSC
jgi:hypothetical protein